MITIIQKNTATGQPSPFPITDRLLGAFLYCPRLCWLEHRLLATGGPRFSTRWDETTPGWPADNSGTGASADPPQASTWADTPDQRAWPESPDGSDAATDPREDRLWKLVSLRLGAEVHLDLLHYSYLESPRSFEGTDVDTLMQALRDVEGLPVLHRRRAPHHGAIWDSDLAVLCLQLEVMRDLGQNQRLAAVCYREDMESLVLCPTRAHFDWMYERLEAAREMLEAGGIPPLLANSARCARCRMSTRCAPYDRGPDDDGVYEFEDLEETGLEENVAYETDTFDEETLAGSVGEGAEQTGDLEVGDLEMGDPAGGDPDDPGRKLVPGLDHRHPLIVQAQGYSVGLNGETLEVRDRGKKVRSVRFIDLSYVALMGNIQITAQALRALAERGIVLLHASYNGWQQAVTLPAPHKNILLRRQQYRAADDPQRSLALARAFVAGKIRNCRTLLRRNATGLERHVLDQLEGLRKQVLCADSLARVMGLEGTAARLYFGVFQKMFKATDDPPPFLIDERNRRPPRDPVNAMLSYVYAMLVRDLTGTVIGLGLEPYLGFLHQVRYGRPSLALDLMEELRPLLADSVVVRLINQREVVPGDFEVGEDSVLLKKEARKRVIEAYHRRLAQEVIHPELGLTLSYQRILEVQARLLARVLMGELEAYPPFYTR